MGRSFLGKKGCTLVCGHRITQFIHQHRQSKKAMQSTKKHKNPGVQRIKQKQMLQQQQ